MMLLGLVLHAAVSYGAADYGDSWPYQDRSTSPLLDWIVFYIHVFRMPIFYAMAGFFAAMLYERRGAGGFVRHRATRIVVPFVVGWLVLFPLIRTGFIFAVVARDNSLFDGYIAVLGTTLKGDLYADSTAHLWFLHYLIMFYVASLIGLPLLRKLPAAWRSGGLELFARLVRSRWRAVWFALPTVLTMSTMRYGGLDTSPSFLPDPKIVLAYFVFFVFGWLLWPRRDLLTGLTRGAWTQTIAAALITPFNAFFVARLMGSIPGTHPADFTISVITGALIVWLYLFGITGLFLRYFDRHHPLVRYVVDASYWLYLIHLPFAIWVPGLLSGLSWPAELKALLVLALSSPFWLASYHLLVRATFIGVVLNGRRYPLRL
jgi:fucose 4-O-acetylase-like acetyltransferase